MSETPEPILAKIREAKDKQLKKLDLTGSYQDKLTQVPAEVFELAQLEVLNLRENQLTTVPDAMAQLQNLTSLDLSSNRLTTIPDALGQLQNLTLLNLRGNQLTAIPDWIAQLQNLRILDLQQNQLTAIPDRIAQLQCLTELDLGGNQLSTVPISLSQLQNLIDLDLGGNQLTTVPGVIYELVSLGKLSFTNYNFDKYKNQIKEISPKILQLKNLKTLELKDNPVEIPPPEVVNLDKDGNADIEKIKNYFRQLANEGKDYLYEAKLLIVGEGGAGKTTLAKKIEDTSYQLRDDEVSTKGIEVIRWEFPLPGDPLNPPYKGGGSGFPPFGGD